MPTGTGVAAAPAGDHSSVDQEPNVVLKPDGPTALKVATGVVHRAFDEEDRPRANRHGGAV
jgi:hypothetical protein